MDFDTFYEQQFQKIYQYIRYMVSNVELAEDLTQETFLKFYKAKFRHEASAETFIRQIARNLVYDHYRKKALIEWLPFTKLHEKQEITYVPHDWIIQEENRQTIYEALHQLKPIQREVIIYRKIEELSIKETCEIMGISDMKMVNTQRSAMKALQKILGGDIDEYE